MQQRDSNPLRTDIMYNNMKKNKWVTEKRNGKSYLVLNKRLYRIVESSLTDFCSETILSVGATLGREIILLDPKDVYLQKRYQSLKDRISREKTERSQKGMTLQPSDVLEMVVRFVRHEINPHEVKVSDQAIQELCDGWKGEKYQNMPVIPLQHFLQKKSGVCRHHALFVAFLLNSLMNDRLIPKGQIHHHRDNIKNGAHVWVTYQPDAQRNTLFLIDSLWNVIANILSRSTKEQQKIKNYGIQAIEKCKIYTNIFDKESYTAFGSEKEKKYFIHELLNLSENDRRELLNRQYAMFPQNIMDLTLDLQRTTFYREYSNYRNTLNDLSRTSSTLKLHKQNYHDIVKSDDRQQFVLGLLNLSTKECNGIIEYQGKLSLKNLALLKTSLNSDQINRKPLYVRFKNYDEVNRYIDQLIEEYAAKKLLNSLGRYIRESSWEVGPQFQRYAIENKTVPTHVAEQYQEIELARKGKKSWTEAKKEVCRIGKSQSQCHKFFRKPATRHYYEHFKDEKLLELQKKFSA